MQNNSLIAQFNRIYNDYCSIYRNIAKHFGLSETVFWILYTLIDENKPITQSYLCGIIYLPKQTINSALKKLETEGYIKLFVSELNRKNKMVALTDKGEKLARQTADKILAAEERAFNHMTDDEIKQLMVLYDKYLTVLETEIENL